MQQQQHQKQSSHVCGIKGSKRSQRVVGGSDSYPGEWCWQIALVNQQNKYICGGVLIGKQWALTAAHCVTNYLRKNEAIFIRAGEYDLTRNNRFGQMQKVQTIYVHHNHNSQSLDNGNQSIYYGFINQSFENYFIFFLPNRYCSNETFITNRIESKHMFSMFTYMEYESFIIIIITR